MKYVTMFAFVAVLGLSGMFEGLTGRAFGQAVSTHARQHPGAIACHVAAFPDKLPFDCHDHHE